jgi:hypothetical protein
VKSSFCRDCGTGYGVLVEIDAVRLAALRGEALRHGDRLPGEPGRARRALGAGWRGIARAFAAVVRVAA